MNFEGPAKKLSGIPAEPVLRNKSDRRKRLVAAATVGMLAAVDAYAQGDAQEYPVEPTAVIKYDGMPNLNRVSVDEWKRKAARGARRNLVARFCFRNIRQGRCHLLIQRW